MINDYSRSNKFYETIMNNETKKNIKHKKHKK